MHESYLEISSHHARRKFSSCYQRGPNFLPLYTFLLQIHVGPVQFLVNPLPLQQWKSVPSRVSFSRHLKIPLPVYIFQSVHFLPFHTFQNNRTHLYPLHVPHVQGPPLGQNEK